MAMQHDDIMARFNAITNKTNGVKTTAAVDSDGITWFKPKDGINVIRILPTLNADDPFFLEFLIHYKVGPQQKAVICPRNVGEQCQVCAMVKEMYETKDVEITELASKIRAKKRYRVNVLDMNDLTKGIQLFEFGPDVYEKLIKLMTNPGVRDLSDADTGRAIQLTKSGTGLMTAYEVSPMMDVHVLEAQYRGKGNNLANTVLSRLVDAVTIEKILNGELEDTRQGSAPLKKFVNTDTETSVVQQQEVAATPTPVTTVVAQAPVVPVTVVAASNPTTTSVVQQKEVAATPTPVTTVEVPVNATVPVPSAAPMANKDIMAKIKELQNKTAAAQKV